MCSIMGYEGKYLTDEDFKKGFNMTISRGPDMSRIIKLEDGCLAFHRLAIMGLNENGMQPFKLDKSYVVCNGEIYGFRKLKNDLINKGYIFNSESDCEILLPLYKEYKTEMFKMLDAEFALIIYDGINKKFIAARDPIGIRPLYYGYDKKGKIILASEPKNIVGLADEILPFPPGHYYVDGKFYCYNNISKVSKYNYDDVETACQKIKKLLISGVEKRLDADAPLGFLLS